MLRCRSIKMSDENKINNDDKGPGKNGDFRVPPKTWIVWIAIIGGILALVLIRNQVNPQENGIKPSEFLSLVDEGRIDSATINFSPQSPIYEISGKYRPQAGAEKPTDNKPATAAAATAAAGNLVPFHVKLLLTDSMVDKLEK